MTYSSVDESSSPRNEISFLHDVRFGQHLHHVEERRLGFEEV
jgi:hypothetical protein